MRGAPCVFLAVTTLFGCGRVASTQRREDTALRIGQAWAINGLNPVMPDDGFAAEANYLVFDRLVFRDAAGKATGGLLERWQAVDGGRRFLLTLRAGIRFHDGSPVTAEDLEFTFEAIQNPSIESIYASLLDIESVERVDGLTVSVRLTHPFWHFPELLEFGVLPEHLLRGQSIKNSAFNQHPVGAGPFRALKIENGSVSLERNVDYYGLKPEVERVIVNPYDSEQLWRRLLARQIEVALLIPWSKHRFLGQLHTIRTDEGTRLVAFAICFNLKRKPFDRAEARRALASAIDRRLLVERTQFGFAKPTERLTHDEVTRIPYDLESARNELGGQTLHLTLVGSDSNQVDVAMDLQRQLAASDITLVIDPDKPWETADMTFCTHLDPQPLEYGAYKYGTALNPDSKDIDAIFDRIAETRDEAIRRSLFKEVEDRILDGAPKTILFWQTTFSAYRAEYCGYHMVSVFDGLEKMRPCP